MAQTKAAPTEASAPTPLQLTPTDVLGSIQRLLTDLHHYLSAPQEHVDPRVVMSFLERGAQLTLALPSVTGTDTSNAAADRKAG